MKYGNIKFHDIANGEGVRTSLFVSGCRNRCPGCFQPQTQDFGYGEEFTEETAWQILRSLDDEFVQGLSVLGGEPFEEENQRVLVGFLERVKERFPEKDIWCWTGYVLDKDLLTGHKHCEVTDRLLSMIDVLVDGPFIMSKKSLSLYYRGSDNQRVINLKESLKRNEIVLYHD